MGWRFSLVGGEAVSGLVSGQGRKPHAVEPEVRALTAHQPRHQYAFVAREKGCVGSPFTSPIAGRRCADSAWRSRAATAASTVGSVMVTGRACRWQDAVSHAMNSSRPVAQSVTLLRSSATPCLPSATVWSALAAVMGWPPPTKPVSTGIWLACTTSTRPANRRRMTCRPWCLVALCFVPFAEADRARRRLPAVPPNLV